MRIFKKTSFISFILILLVAFSAGSCSSKFGVINAADSPADGDFSEPSDISEAKLNEPSAAAPQNISLPAVKAASTEELIKSEMDKLTIKLAPYMDSESPFYVGEEHKEYLLSYLLKPEGFMEPIEAAHWEKIVRLLFLFDKEKDKSIKMYISDFVYDKKLERQHAVSGLMKLLSMRYPLTLGGDFESLKKSNEISDIETLEDKHETLARQAYCLGLTDITVENSKAFRANSFLTRGEAASMLHRILLKLGLPAVTAEEIETPVIENFEKLPEADVLINPEHALTIEDIRFEYESYIKSLREPKSSKKEKKLESLIKAQAILEIDFSDENLLIESITIAQWKQILLEVFSLQAEQIEPYIYHETDGSVPFDAAAIGIFKLSWLSGGFDARDATEKELESARLAVPQFDTARDISKFAQMYSSGLLNGLYQMPGFTPQRPVSKAEAILIVKRIIENMK